MPVEEIRKFVVIIGKAGKPVEFPLIPHSLSTKTSVEVWIENCAMCQDFPSLSTTEHVFKNSGHEISITKFALIRRHQDTKMCSGLHPFWVNSFLPRNCREDSMIPMNPTV